MMDTNTRLAAIDQLLEDFELIAMEKVVVATWVQEKLVKLQETYVSPSDQTLVRAMKRGLYQMKYDYLLDAETFEEYSENLRVRRTELISDGDI